MLISKFLSNTFTTLGVVSAPVVGVGFLYRSYPNALSTSSSQKKYKNTAEEIEEAIKKEKEEKAKLELAIPASSLAASDTASTPALPVPVVDVPAVVTAENTTVTKADDSSSEIDALNKSLEDILKKKIDEKAKSKSSSDSGGSVTLEQSEWQSIIEEIIKEWEEKVKAISEDAQKEKWNKAIKAVKEIKEKMTSVVTNQ